MSNNSAVIRAEIKQGLQDALPITLAIVPYAVVFGAFAIDQGLSIFGVLLASATMFGVAGQYVMVELMGQDVPVWSILVAVLAVNFRHVLYSASLQNQLGAFALWQKALAFFLLTDPQYASSAARAEQHSILPSYYFSYAFVVYGAWMVANVFGVLFGGLLGDISRLGLDLLLPMFFASLVISFRKRPRFAPVLLVSVSVAVSAYFFIGSPWHITLGGFSGIFTAAILSKPKQPLEGQHA